MNKKVLTLCAGLLLSGSLASVYATDVTPQAFLGAIKGYYLDASELNIQDGIVNFTDDVQLPNTADQATRGTMPVVILGPDCEGLTFTSTSGKEFTGHIIVAAENVTIKDMKIANPLLTIQDGNTPLTQSTIVAFADNVTIKDNTFNVYEPSGFNQANSVKGLILLPQTSKADYNKTITGNTFEGFDYLGSLNGSNWYSSAVQVLQDTKLMQNKNIKCNGYTEAMAALSDVVKGIYLRDTDTGTNSAILENFSAEEFINSNSISTSTVNVIVEKGGKVTEAYIDDITSDAGKIAVSQLYNNAEENSVFAINNTLDETQDVIKELDLGGTPANFTGPDYNVGIDNPEKLDNGKTDVTAGKNIPTNWGSYTRSTGTTNKVVLIYDGKAVKATKDAQGKVTYSLGEYDKNSYSEDNTASQYFFTLTPYELSAGRYELRLKDNYGNYFKVKDQYVTVKNVQVKVEEGKELYSSDEKQTWVEYNGENVVFPSELLLTAGGNNKYVKYDENTGFGVQNNYYLAQAFGISDIQIANVYASTLIDRYGDHFTLKITYKDDYSNDIDVTGVFAGNLRPCKVYYSNNETIYNYNLGAATDYMLVDANGNIIAIDLEKPLLAGKSEYGYTLTTISPKDYWLKPSKYAAWFSMEYTPGKDVDEVTAITDIKLGKTEGSSEYTLGLQKNSEGKIVLVAAGENYLLDEYTISVKLNEGSVVTPSAWLTKPVYYTVKSINKKTNSVSYGRFAGKALGLEENGYIKYVDTENVDLTQPEGQFAIIYDGEYKVYRFVNREVPTAGYYTDIVLDEDKLYQIDATTFAYVNGTTTPDTLSIEPVSNYSSEDGFKRFSPAELNANTYTVSMKLLNGSLLNIIEKHNDKHRLGLDEDNATEWRIEMPTVKLLDNTGDFLRYAADTISNVAAIKFYADGDWRTTQINNPKEKYYYPNTELQICTYILKNTDTNEYLNGKDFDESTGNAYYVCNEDEKTATRIAFKLNGEGAVNLVPVSTWTSGNSAYEPYNFNGQLSGYKIQGGASGDVLKDTELYEATANDLFVINVAEAPTYKKMEQGDKIILSLKNNTENVLVEGPVDGFTTISNREAHKDLNPTLYVDTAYVNRVGNYAYQYLLGVRINRVDTTYECNVPAHGTHRADTTFGYFLVNMIDSAKACTDVHNNKFVYNEDYKLDFVKGYHTNDTLFFTNDADEVISSMKIGDASYNMAKFAFKMIDEEANEFVIETGKGYDKQTVKKGSTWATVTNEVTTPSYLRWVNGNLVVTDNIDDAAHFTMEASDKEATANETISAGNVVVAGVDGAVVVKGAEGKNVIVSTILGKVVANEVVSSDNATIAAPAGIVVVSVDGESFKVVVK